MREPSLYVAHIAVEMAPIAKVGGLGDVVVALGRAVQEQGHQVDVILPRWVPYPGARGCTRGCTRACRGRLAGVMVCAVMACSSLHTHCIPFL